MNHLPWVAQVHPAFTPDPHWIGEPPARPPRISFMMLHKLTGTHERAHLGLEMPADATPEAIELARRCVLHVLNAALPHPDDALSVPGVQRWSGRVLLAYQPISTPPAP